MRPMIAMTNSERFQKIFMSVAFRRHFVNKNRTPSIMCRRMLDFAVVLYAVLPDRTFKLGPMQPYHYAPPRYRCF